MTEHRLFSLSPSRVTTWLDCPRRFRLTYIERRRGSGAWAHQSLGLSIHAVLRDWFDLPAAERTRESVTSLTRRAWLADGYRDQEHSERWRDRAGEISWRYLEQMDPEFEPFGRERDLGARTQVITIRGRIDRLDQVGDDRELAVVDYKTGRSVPGPDDARSSVALAAYAHCVRQSLRRPCSRVELHHVPTGEVVSWEHSEESLARHLHRLDAIGAEMADAQRRVADGDDADAVFPAAPGPLCSWCDVRDWCSVAAGTAKIPWAGLPDDV